MLTDLIEQMATISGKTKDGSSDLGTANCHSKSRWHTRTPGSRGVLFVGVQKITSVSRRLRFLFYSRAPDIADKFVVIRD